MTALQERIARVMRDGGWTRVKCASVDGSIDAMLDAVKELKGLTITWSAGVPWIVSSTATGREASGQSKVERPTEFRNRPGNLKRMEVWRRKFGGRRRAAA
jgi:hypothetical protein